MVSIDNDSHALALTDTRSDHTGRNNGISALFGGREWVWFAVGLGMSLLWLVAAMGYLVHNFGASGFADISPPEIGMLATAILLPLVALWLVIGYSRQSEESRRQVRFLDRRLTDIKSSDTQRLRQAQAAAESMESQASAFRMAAAFALQQIQEAEAHLSTRTDALQANVRKAEDAAEAQAARLQKHGDALHKLLEKFSGERDAIDDMMTRFTTDLEKAGSASRQQLDGLSAELDKGLAAFQGKLDSIVTQANDAKAKLSFQTDALQAAADHVARKGDKIGEALAAKSSRIITDASEAARNAEKIIADLDAGAGRMQQTAQAFYDTAQRSDALVSARATHLVDMIADTHSKVDDAGDRFEEQTKTLTAMADGLAARIDAAHMRYADKLGQTAKQIGTLEQTLENVGNRLQRDCGQVQDVGRIAVENIETVGATLKDKSMMMETLIEELAGKTATTAEQNAAFVESTETNIVKMERTAKDFLEKSENLKSDAHDISAELAAAGSLLVDETDALTLAGDRARLSLQCTRDEIQQITEQGTETVTKAGAIREGIVGEIERLNRLSDALETRADAYLATAKERDAAFSSLSQQLSEGLETALTRLNAAVSQNKTAAETAVLDITEAGTALAGQAGALTQSADQTAERLSEHADTLAARIGQFGQAGTDTTAALLGAADRINDHTSKFTGDVAAMKSVVSDIDLYTEQFASRVETNRMLLDDAVKGAESMVDAAMDMFSKGGEQISDNARRESQRMADAGQEFADAADAMASVADHSERSIRTAAEAIGHDLGKVETTVEKMTERLKHIEESAASARGAMSREHSELEEQIQELTHSLDEHARDIESVSQRVSGTAKLVGLTFRQQTKDLLDASKSAKRQYERLQAQQAIDPGRAFVDRLTEVTDILNSTGIDLTKAIEGSVPDDIWQQYLAGDRGIIARRLQQMKKTYGATEIRAHFDSDSQFREAANRYMAQFEKLLDDIATQDPEEMISVVFLTSDVGKIYLLLCRALDRHN